MNMNTNSTSADESGIDKSSNQSEDTKAQTSESTPVGGATKGGAARYNYSAAQKTFLKSLASQYVGGHDKKRRQMAFNALYTAELVSNPMFATPATKTAEEWKQCLLRWFDNNAKKYSSRASATNLESQGEGPREVKPQKARKTVAIPSSSPAATNVPESLTWAKLRDLSKFFTEITGAGMDVRSGRALFAANRGVEEDKVSAEWNQLSSDERDKWEQQAARGSDIEQNRKRFVSGLRVLLQGCLQFGHLGYGEMVTMITFDEGLGDTGRDIISDGFFSTSDTRCTNTIQHVLKDYNGLTRELSAHLNESLKVKTLKELNLATEVPVDTQGHARYPMIANMDDASRSQLKHVYEDFMRAIWFQAGYEGPVRYDAIEKSPSDYYDGGILPPNLGLRNPASSGGWLLDVVGHLMMHHSENGSAFVFHNSTSTHSSPATLDSTSALQNANTPSSATPKAPKKTSIPSSATPKATASQPVLSTPLRFERIVTTESFGSPASATPKATAIPNAGTIPEPSTPYTPCPTRKSTIPDVTGLTATAHSVAIADEGRAQNGSVVGGGSDDDEGWMDSSPAPEDVPHTAVADVDTGEDAGHNNLANEQDAAPDADKDGAPDAYEDAAHDANEVAAPDANEVTAPDADEVAAPDADEVAAPDADEDAASDAAESTANNSDDDEDELASHAKPTTRANRKASGKREGSGRKTRGQQAMASVGKTRGMLAAMQNQPMTRSQRQKRPAEGAPEVDGSKASVRKSKRRKL